MPGNDTAGAQRAVTATLPPELAAQFSQMATLIPSEDGESVPDILQAILCASSWEQLDRPWDACDASRLVGKLFRIDNVLRRPSLFPGGLSVYLVVRCTNGKTGERFAWTSSSLNVCAQLVRAYAGGWLPLWATITVLPGRVGSDRRPHYLRFYGPENPSEAAA